MTTPGRRFIELTAGGADDPDALRAATVLSAYFHAEQMRLFRRLLWPRLRMIAGMWLVVGLTRLFSVAAIAVGLCVFAAVACWAALAEWAAEKRLNTLLAGLPSRPT